MASSFMIPSNT